MKKLLLLALSAGLALGASAQKGTVTTSIGKKTINEGTVVTLSAARTTAVGDTITRSHISLSDTPRLYLAPGTDTGFIVGMDAFGDKGFAERYDVKGSDSTMQVLGVVTLFGGTINTSSSKTVNLNVWSEGAKTTWIRPTLFNSGYPNTVLTSRNVSIKSLGIGVADTALDTFKTYAFATPTAYLTKNFFVGYDISYTWATANGDTISLYSSKIGSRVGTAYTVSGTDTTINNVNCTQYADGTWHDNLQSNFGVAQNLYVFPIVKIGAAVINSVNGVTRKGLTFYGNYPNPAATSTNVRFALAKSTDVTISVMDASGKVVSTVNNSNMSAGEHTISLETTNLAAGNYIYLIRTTEGEGMASQLTVAK